MRRVGLIVVPDVQMINFGALSVFELANAKSGQAHYDLVVMSERGGAVRNSFGMEISTEPLDRGSFDTILMGSPLEPRSATPGLISYLRSASETTRRLVSICVGAFTFGEAGLLRNRRATTHWAFSADLQRRFPDTKVEMDRIFLADGQIWTSAGMTACIDLALEMVESAVATFGSAGHRRQIRPGAKSAHICPATSGRAAVERTTGRGSLPQSTAVYPRVSR
jgi:transcriptional regulator GlxA family with amidase domain